MERIQTKQLNKLCDYLNLLIGGNTLSVEHGSSYTNWKLVTNSGSRIVLTAPTRRELFNEMHAFKEGLFFAHNNKLTGQLTDKD